MMFFLKQIKLTLMPSTVVSVPLVWLKSEEFEIVLRKCVTKKEADSMEVSIKLSTRFFITPNITYVFYNFLNLSASKIELLLAHAY